MMLCKIDSRHTENLGWERGLLTRAGGSIGFCIYRHGDEDSFARYG